MAVSKPFTYELAANAVVTINRQGTFVYCVSSGEEFSVQGLNKKGYPDEVTEINQGIGHEMSPFDRLRVINGPNAQTVKLYLGDNRVIDNRQYGSISAGIASVDGLSDVDDVTLVNGAAAAQIVAANADRQTLHILNTSTTNTLRIGSSNVDAGRGIPIGPGLSFTMNNFDGALYGYADGANIDVAVLEVTT